MQIYHTNGRSIIKQRDQNFISTRLMWYINNGSYFHAISTLPSQRNARLFGLMYLHTFIPSSVFNKPSASPTSPLHHLIAGVNSTTGLTKQISKSNSLWLWLKPFKDYGRDEFSAKFFVVSIRALCKIKMWTARSIDQACRRGAGRRTKTKRWLSRDRCYISFTLQLELRLENIVIKEESFWQLYLVF